MQSQETTKNAKTAPYAVIERTDARNQDTREPTQENPNGPANLPQHDARRRCFHRLFAMRRPRVWPSTTFHICSHLGMDCYGSIIGILYDGEIPRVTNFHNHRKRTHENNRQYAIF